MNQETPQNSGQPTPDQTKLPVLGAPTADAPGVGTQSPNQGIPKKPAPVSAAKVVTPKPAIGGPVPPLFRAIDWWTFAVTSVLIFIGYMLTISPDLTLEDCGELAVGSMYAGVPHPPGYPVWTMFTWLFTKILPFHNISWRVSVASAVAGALASGVIGLMVSRGSSMFIESIAELKNIDRRWENAICIVSGFVAGVLLAFNGFMWSQAVIVEVYPLSVLSLTLVMVCLLRWMYAPHQRRYLYWAAFLFGICVTNHQTLVVAAMGVEIVIIAAEPKLGRDLLLVNCIFWLGGLFAKGAGMIHTFDADPGGGINLVYVIFNLVGLSSVAAWIWFVIRTKQPVPTEWKPVLIMAILFFVGAGFYFYMPIASMSNPPMNWGYPRTPEGFFHALSRGQYEKTHPTDFIHDPLRLVQQTVNYFGGAAEEFSKVYLLAAIVPFLFFFRMQRRERAWMIGLTGIYFCLAFLLMILLNPSPDRQTRNLVRVFFTASYVPIAMWIGYGLTLTGAWIATQYERSRFWIICGGVLACMVGFYELTETIANTFKDAPSGLKVFSFGLGHLGERGLGGLPIWGSIVVLTLAAALLIILLLSKRQLSLTWVLVIFALMPISSLLSHWADNEQRGHLFGFWFGHDMFTPPFPGKDGKLTYDPKERAEALKDPNRAKYIYPEMDRDTVLFGGTDPGRFCPTYMIFCESFIPPARRRDANFDRRDVYLITQNALADGTYLNYIRAHYNRSAQKDPPFFQNFLPYVAPSKFHGPTSLLVWLDDIFETLGDKIEKSRRTGSSYFRDSDFVDLNGFTGKLRKKEDGVAKFVAEKLSGDTQSLLAGSDEKALRTALAKDLNQLLDSGSIYEAERFKNVKVPVLIEEQLKDPNTLPNTTIRLNRRLLEEAFPEIARTPGGVFPDTEIHTPSPEESQTCFNEYLYDAQKRLDHDSRHPEEPKQIKPGEDVRIDNGRVQVTGQVAVMSINGLLTKVIFDKNPHHEFYVEESFPLDWMYPYLTPFGIIMKINRNPLTELSQEICDRDHRFWSDYSERMIGNWVAYDTKVSDLCTWAEQVYLNHDYRHFKGDPKFVRDDNGQKAFSKLRSSIGGIYQWRSLNYKTEPERQRMLKEAEFAFKQAFAYCPYSPEAVYRYVQLLLTTQRVDDALLIAKTCQKLDPNNGQIENLVSQLEGSRKGSSSVTVQSVLAQINQYIKARQTNEASIMLDQLLNHPQSDSTVLMVVAQTYLTIGNMAKAEAAIQRVTKLMPDSAENWYNLSGLQAAQGKVKASAESLKKAFDIFDAQPAHKPGQQNLHDYFKADHNFDMVRHLPDFQKLAK